MMHTVVCASVLSPGCCKLIGKTGLICFRQISLQLDCRWLRITLLRTSSVLCCSVYCIALHCIAEYCIVLHQPKYNFTYNNTLINFNNCTQPQLNNFTRQIIHRSQARTVYIKLTQASLYDVAVFSNNVMFADIPGYSLFSSKGLSRCQLFLSLYLGDSAVEHLKPTNNSLTHSHVQISLGSFDVIV